VRPIAIGGYLYGLAVHRDYQHQGIGSKLTKARLDGILKRQGRAAVVLAMFWNVRFFKRFGFRTVPRIDLPSSIRQLADFRNPTYRRSAALSVNLSHTARASRSRP
jgi:N-acetylglutamate synthase-like GNAT family acetyltransferase